MVTHPAWQNKPGPSYPLPPLREGAFRDRAEQGRGYWRQTSRLMAVVLAVWALLALGLPLAAPGLSAVAVLGFPLGYWLAAQGSLAGFVLLAFWYVRRQNAIDETFQVAED